MRSISLNRANGLLLLALLAVGFLYIGRPFLVPLAFAGLLAMLLRPVSNRLERWGLGRAVAALLCVLLVVGFLGALAWLIGSQAEAVAEQLPQLKAQLQQELARVQQWVQQQFGVAPARQLQLGREQVAKMSQSAGRLFSTSLKGMAQLLGGLVLVLLYLFFLLWQRHKFREFVLQLAAPESRPELIQTLNQISQVGSQYLMGRLVSMIFLAAVYSLGFVVIGLKNPLGLSLVAVLPTIVPYVGAYVGAIFPLVMALGSGTGLLPVLGVIMVAQVIDNNIIEPVAMGSALHLGPLFTIVAIVLGELLWGIPGMILFEPLLAIIRIACSHVPRLHPYAYLLGEEASGPGWAEKLKRLFKRH